MRRLVTLLVAVLALFACTDGGSSSTVQDPGDAVVLPDPESQPEPELEPEADVGPEVEVEVGPELTEVVLPFLDALEAASSSDRAQALDFAAEGSPAARYATVTDGWMEAFSPGGDGLPPISNTVLPDGQVRSCWEYAETEQCSVYGGFVVDGDELVSFEVDGQPIGPRLAAVPDEVFPLAGGAVLAPVGALADREPDGLQVVFSVTAADTAVNVAIRRAGYQTSGGDRVMTPFGMGPDLVEAGTTATFSALFTEVETGGTFVLEGFADTSPNRQTWEVSFPVLPPA